MKKFLFAFTFIFVATAEQDVTSALQALEGKLPTSLLQELPSLNEGDDLLKEKCLKNGNNETYDQVVEGKQVFQKCVQDMFDYDKMKKEIEKAKPTGDLDMVFRKYCKQSPKLRGCIETFLNVTEPCLDENERGHKPTFLNITDSLINFICYKEGDRIALFIAEGGPGCIESKVEEIQECLNETLGQYTEGGEATASLPVLLLDEKQCREVYKIQTCVVNHLEKCSEPTPANIVGSLFEFVKKNTPCKNYKFSVSKSSTFSISALALLTPLFAYIVTRL